MSAVTAAGTTGVHAVAGVRWAAGHPSGRQTAVDTGMAIDASLAVSAGHQLSGGRSSGSSGRSIRRPLRLVTTSSTLPPGSRRVWLRIAKRSPALARRGALSSSRERTERASSFRR